MDHVLQIVSKNQVVCCLWDKYKLKVELSVECITPLLLIVKEVLLKFKILQKRAPKRGYHR